MANGTFKIKKDIDRYDPRLMPSNCKNLDPPYFSLPTTFNETLLRIPFSVIRRTFSNADLSLAVGKMRKINLSLSASGMFLQNHRRLPVSIFRVKRLFRVLEAGYWKYFQNY
jgi:hypothetical protein